MITLANILKRFPITLLDSKVKIKCNLIK
jgi:hypothetical protein